MFSILKDSTVMMSEYDVTCGYVSHLTSLSSFSIEYYPNSSALHSNMGGDMCVFVWSGGGGVTTISRGVSWKSGD